MSKVICLVIDADIARSSGTTQNPISSGSRALLTNVLDNGHSVAMCGTLNSEWKKHKSKFATTWLSTMVARKRIKFINPIQKIDEEIESAFSDEKKKGIALKDSHLVDSALFFDKVIASNDDAARSVFCELSIAYGEITSVKWFNAVSDRKFISDYLSKVGFVPDDYYLKMP